MITGQFTSRQKRYLQGLAATLLVLAVFLFLLLGGRLNFIEYRGLDLLHRIRLLLSDNSKVSSEIVMVYIDQKSIDSFRRNLDIGWPWPRDFYARAVQYLSQAGARAIVFDATYSEPSVFANTVPDDETFAKASAQSGRVFQTLMFHREVKDKDAPINQEALAGLLQRGLAYQHQGGPRPAVFEDVTTPILPLEESAWGLGVISIDPEPDGVVRRLRPMFAFRDHYYSTLSLAVYLKLNRINQVIQTQGGLDLGGLRVPLDKEGKVLLSFYGRSGVYPEFNYASIIQSAAQLEAKEKPLVPLESFKNKIVFIGAKAAALYDLRSTPLDKSLPGVEIHAALLNSLIARDFLRQGSTFWRGLLPALLLLCTLSAAVLTRSAVTGAFLSLALAVLYVLGVVYGFRQNVWLDLISPVLGQGVVFILASLINYYGEGREKSAVRSAFSLYLSPAVVNNVLENPQMLSLGGSRRVMTCFFSDLAGFTTISEKLSPEDLVHLLNRYLSLMTKAIMDSGGTVDKYEGDAIMAFWGAPLIQEDHARRACLSALEQQKILAAFRAEVMAEGLPEIRVRMGLNTGPMIVGNMGSEERLDYTVMGDAVNLASRLEGANKQYGTETMISESTYHEVEGQVEVRELDLLRVKGKKEPIRVFELVAEKGGTPAGKSEVIARYNQGLILYRDMDFSAAERSFLQALEIDSKDGPSKTYVERCRAYQQQPPPVDWDRVFTMTTK